jgi:hypothetical protein
VVAAALVAAGPVAGASGLGPEVAAIVRTGVCIVAGDVCRAADARAAGLSPCTMADHRRGGSVAVTIFSVRVASGEQVTVARRSDGTFLVVANADDSAGLDVGLGAGVGPLQLGAEAIAELKVARATAWELPDEAAARRFLDDADLRRSRAPLWRSGSLALATSGWAGLGARISGDLAAGIGGAEIAAQTAAGVRIGRGTTTYFLRADASGPQIGDALGHTIGGRSFGPLVAEYTRDDEGPRELAFRVTASGSGGQVVETVARMDLRDPVSRALAARLLRRAAPWPAEAFDDIRAAIRRAAAVGTVERSVYAVQSSSKDLALAGRLGISVALEAGREDVVRRLVSASAWTPGSGERAREDCLG